MEEAKYTSDGIYILVSDRRAYSMVHFRQNICFFTVVDNYSSFAPQIPQRTSQTKNINHSFLAG
jgi:hypothetical protein